MSSVPVLTATAFNAIATMAAVSHALLLVVVLCAFQTSTAFIDLPWHALETTVDALKNSSEATLNKTFSDIKSKVNDLEKSLETNLASALTASTAEINKLVEDAENEGVAAAECGVAAATNLTNINIALPISLAHCFFDYINPFGYYFNRTEDDISESEQVIKDGIAGLENCAFLDVSCDWSVFYNATKYQAKVAADVAFTLTDSATAGVNLVATITQCDKEKNTQALLDVAKVVPDTKRCIEQKKAAAASSS